MGGSGGGVKDSAFDLHRTHLQTITSGDSHVNYTFNLLESQVHTSVQDPVHTFPDNEAQLSQQRLAGVLVCDTS